MCFRAAIRGLVPPHHLLRRLAQRPPRGWPSPCHPLKALVHPLFCGALAVVRSTSLVCIRGYSFFNMQKIDSSAAGALLLDVCAVAQALGFSVHQARRFLAAPPAGFPPPLRVGARIFVRRPQLEAWARGESLAASSAPEAPSTVHRQEPTGRPRGRPRKFAGGMP